MNAKNFIEYQNYKIRSRKYQGKQDRDDYSKMSDIRGNRDYRREGIIVINNNHHHRRNFL